MKSERIFKSKIKYKIKKYSIAKSKMSSRSKMYRNTITISI